MFSASPFQFCKTATVLLKVTFNTITFKKKTAGRSCPFKYCFFFIYLRNDVFEISVGVALTHLKTIRNKMAIAWFEVLSDFALRDWGKLRKPSARIVCVEPKQFKSNSLRLGRSRWSRGLRRGSAAAGLLGLWVRIPPWTWMSVSC